MSPPKDAEVLAAEIIALRELFIEKIEHLENVVVKRSDFVTVSHAVETLQRSDERQNAEIQDLDKRMDRLTQIGIVLIIITLLGQGQGIIQLIGGLIP